MIRHNISDEKWEIIGPLLVREKRDLRGRPLKDARLMFNGILWIIKTGAPWRDLPEFFGPWQTVYKRFAMWAKLALWDGILSVVSKDADFESIMIDASYVKVHQHGTGAKGGTSLRRLVEARAA